MADFKDKRYHTLDAFFKEKFGSKVFKVPLDARFTCPNKDGTKGVGGCIYCAEGGGGAGSDKTLPLREQYAATKARLLAKWPTAKTIPYFQANSNTYAAAERLKRLYHEALSLDDDIVGLAIATRPDCLEEETLDLLENLNKKTCLQVELGLQTIHEETAERINRGHDLACFEAALHALRKRDIDTVVHIINGLPGESAADMIDTARYLAKKDIRGVKIHMLHVLQNTPLEKLHEQGAFDLLTRDEYVDIVVRQLELLPWDVVIHRLTGDAPKELLVAPRWTLKKFVVLNGIDKRMRKEDTWQGRKYPT